MVQNANSDMDDPQFFRDVREKQLFKKYWRCETSRSTGRKYYVHIQSGQKCWPHDFEKVCNDTHAEVRIPEGMPR